MDRKEEKLNVVSHFMVDIETLGNSVDCVILQIAACRVYDPFCTKNKAIDRHVSVFSSDCEIESQLNRGRTINLETISWWLDSNKTDKARKSVLGRSHPNDTGHVLRNFSEWMRDGFIHDEMRVWANSPSFDLAILAHAMEQYDVEVPWKYHQQRDYRTLSDFANSIGVKIPIIDRLVDTPFSQSTDRHNAEFDVYKQTNRLYSIVQYFVQLSRKQFDDIDTSIVF